MSPRRAAAWLAAMTPLAFVASASGAPGASVTLERNAFRVTLADGRVLTQAQLIGVTLTVGDGSGARRRIRIDGVEADSRDPSGETVLYTLSEPDAAGGWANACQPDPDGLRLGFPLPGAFDGAGHYEPDRPGILITCTAGAEGKCVRFGYKPWKAGLTPYYEACVRLVRADYGGDAVAHTRNGTLIDIFDRIGVQADEPARGMTLEAAFGPDGAVCVAHTRLPDLLDMSALVQAYPRLAGHLGADCDESAGLLFVRSFER